MQIEKIACPRLNRKYSSLRNPSAFEVFVQFNDKGKPTGVMCKEYDSQDRCCWIKQEEKYPCIYSDWKRL